MASLDLRDITQVSPDEESPVKAGQTSLKMGTYTQGGNLSPKANPPEFKESVILNQSRAEDHMT